jgi:hypothetical protein
MDVPADALSAESQGELANLQAFLHSAGPTAPAEVSRARARARALGAAVREIPVDIERLAEQCGYPVRDRPLPAGERGTIARDGGCTVIVINRDRPGQAAAERRWVIAEELGHAALEHTSLVASSAPGAAPVMPEPRRRAEEREAKAFAAEILMPADKVRGRFAELAPRIRGALGLRHREAFKCRAAELGGVGQAVLLQLPNDQRLLHSGEPRVQ